MNSDSRGGMDPFRVEETSIPAVKSLLSKFEQLSTPSVSAAGTTNTNGAVNNNGRSTTKPAVPQRLGPCKPRTISGGGAAGEFRSLVAQPPQTQARTSTGTGSISSRNANGKAATTMGSSPSSNELRSSSPPPPGPDLKRPPMGIKRPPPPPPPGQVSFSTSFTQRSQTLNSSSYPSSSSMSVLSTSPSARAGTLGGGDRSGLGSPASSPKVSPHLRPVPVPPASPRPSSQNELDENEEGPRSVVPVKHNRFGDTPSPKMNTPRQGSSTAYPPDTPLKPAIPPRPPKNVDASTASTTASPHLLSTTPDELSPIPSSTIASRVTMTSPFSDDEGDVEQFNLTPPLIPIPIRKPPPPRPPAGGTNVSTRSLGTHSSDSSLASFDAASISSSASAGSSAGGAQRPPPPPPRSSRPKASTVPYDTPIPSPLSSSKFASSPPPVPSRRLNTMPPFDPEPYSTPPSVTLPPPPPRASTRSSLLSPQPPSSNITNIRQDPPAPQSPIAERKSLGSAKLPPPPTRMIGLGDKLPPARRAAGDSSDDESGEEGGATVEDAKGADSFPDSSRSSRRPPIAAPFRAGQFEMPKIPIQAYGGHYVVAGSRLAVGHGYTIKIYDLAVADSPISTIDTKELGKITCMELNADGETGQGGLMWVGTKEGQVFEVDLRKGVVCAMKQVTHSHAVTHVLRYGRSMVTLDEGGKALIYTESGGGVVSLAGTQPRVVRITEKQDFVRMLGGKLWTAARAESQNGVGGATSRLPIIRVYDLFSPARSVGKSVVPTEHVGAVTSAAVVPSQSGQVYVGHEEGFLSIWDVEGTEDGYPRCLEVVKVSTSDVLCVEGVNDRLWVGSRNGMISAYEVAVRPWVVTNSWIAHPGLPVLGLSVDVFGIDEGRLNVVSVGRDEVMKFWDGLLGLDWIENELQKGEESYSTFRDLTALIVSWNCDAARPDSLTGTHANVNLFSDILNVDEPPDVIVFGFQEVIDLESRKMAAKNVLLGGAGKKKHHDEGITGLACSGNGLSDKVTGAYRRWYERLVKEVRAAMPHVPYTVVHTESLVGLFSCIFIKASERFALRDVAVGTVKRGMGGRYGNKGGIVARFVVGDSSICMINCHLAAGQNATRRRNKDFAAILQEKGVLPPTEYSMAYCGGGDGSMILDHEIVFINGDLNYRIDHRREAIISSIRTGDFTNLLAHDQLLREIKFNHGCRFRGFSEGPITFAPTYKYDPRSNEYDSSEKRRLPAWCDRVLWRAQDPSRVQQLHYQRYEANVSDHRPVSAAFKVTIKTIQNDLRTQAMKQVQLLWAEEQARMLAGARRVYKVNDYI